MFNATYSTQIIETVAFKIKMFPCKNLLKYFIKIYDFFQVSGTVGTFTSNSDNVQSINLSSQDSGKGLHFLKTDGRDTIYKSKDANVLLLFKLIK